MFNSRTRQLIGGLALTGALVAGGIALTQDDGGDVANTTDVVTSADNSGTATGTAVLSASDGAAARARLAAFRPGASPADAAAVPLAAESSMLAEDAISGDFDIIDCGVPWEPTEEEVAESNVDTDGLAAAFDAAGIEYLVDTDGFGFRSLDYDWEDAAAQDVADSYWSDRYPPEPIDPEILEQNAQEIAVLAAALDDAGVAYTRTTDDQGWENIEYDYDDQTAQAAIDQAYAELYPPQPPTAEDIEWMTAENDRVAKAFDDAGVVYVRRSDAIGWEWIEWDFDDEAMNDKAMAAFDSLYAVDPLLDPLLDVAIAIEEPDLTIEPIDCEPVEILDDADTGS